MNNELLWTDFATETYTEIIEYYTANYGLDAAIKFDEKVEKVLQQLLLFAHSCPKHPLKEKLRMCMITDKIGMLVFVKNNEIEILAFGNSSQLRTSFFL